MKIIFDELEKAEFERIAKSENLDVDLLEDAYIDTMCANFDQDVWDVACENQNDLAIQDKWDFK